MMTLNLHDHHFSLVVDMDKYTQFHMCPKCRRLFQSEYNLRRHTNIKKDCTRVRFIYKGGVYKNTPTIFERLMELGIETPRELRIYPYKIVFDFKSYFSRSKNNAESQVTNTLLDCNHVPLSASVPVLGFNSGRYDLNLVKRDFHFFYTETDNRDIRTIKRCNQYIAVYTEHSLFLDMVNYLAPGYSYANYLKAFIAGECKGFFPYEWMTSTRKLSNVRLPPRSPFYSSLTGTGISQEQYNSCLLVWRQLGMKTFRDYLIYYNNKDVSPFVKAINEHIQFFIGKGIEMFKDGMTLTVKIIEKGKKNCVVSRQSDNLKKEKPLRPQFKKYILP